ncbi:MAG: ACT domain-containing protein [Acidobacteria bacterium]|nr:MAG: ACT domain-containing protein [Acidobacteriota bacterium]
MQAGRSLQLEILPSVLAVCRLGADDPLPDWALAGTFISITRTSDELSIVCLQEEVPPDVRCKKGWRCLRVEGPLEFSEIGVLASLTAALAAADVSLFALSTFDTDYLLVGEGDLERAVTALRGAGHQVEGAPGP